MTEKCPYCGHVPVAALFKKDDEDGAAMTVECESCRKQIKVVLKVVETYDVSLPDEISKKLVTVGERIMKNPRWGWCICRSDGRNRKSFKCQCKGGTFVVKAVARDAAAGSGYFVTAEGKNGLLGPIDSFYFLPAEEVIPHESLER